MKEIDMKSQTSEVIGLFESEARRRGVGAVALLDAEAKARGMSSITLLERLSSSASKSSVPVRLVESARTPRPQQLLEKVFQSLGHSPAAAKVAAAGRSGLREAAAAKDPAGLGPDAYAYAPDAADPTTWLLQLFTDTDSKIPDPELVKYAVSHLPGIATYGQAVAIPDADLDDVKARLRSAWIAAGLSIDDLPIEMQQLELAASFRRLGITDAVGLRAALRGRSRR